jgi:putative flavoprotein involved in K+ transport
VATTPEAIDVVVIGGGQAGLATSHELGRAGVPHVVLERDRVGSSWAGLWDSFRLNTPNWSLRLPGMAYDGDEPDTFMARTEVIGHLERYSRTTPAEVREGVRVDSLVASDTGVLLATSAGPIETRAVVVCTGAYQRAFRPSGAEALPDDLAVVDTRSYRNPDALPDGAVLVVGSGQSGCQIAEELLEAGREVIVACGKAAWAPRRIGEHDVVWWALETGFFDQRPDDLPSPAARLAANVTVSGAGGGHDLDARILRSRGATLAGRFDGCDGARIRFADDLAASIAWGDDRYREFVHMASELCAARGMPDPALPEPEPFEAVSPASIDVGSLGAVVFSGGFRPDYSWIDVPGICDEMGFPAHHDGASTALPGLFFVGVHFLRTRKSSLLCGVGEDAAVVAHGVAAHVAG